MILDAETDPMPPSLHADVVIVGAGPAGVALARSLSGRALDVVVLESGGAEPEERSQELARATSSGSPEYPVSDTRMRGLGGTTIWWGGWCHPLDRWDLAVRDWVARSGWPIGHDELARWYPAAQEFFEIGPEPFDLEHWRGVLGDAGFSTIETDRLTTRVYRVSHTRIGEQYGPELEEATGVTVWLHATVVNLATTGDGSAVSDVEVVTSRGSRSRVRAEAVVLATGGLEVPRLLLASRDADAAGIGNAHDLVGRCFMEHPHLEAATVLTTEEFAAAGGLELYDLGVEELRPQLVGQLSLRPEVVEEEQLVAATASVAVPVPDTPVDPGAAVGALMADVEDSQPSVQGLQLRGEQEPHPDNRVTLGDSADEHGVPQLHLHWKVRDPDVERYARTVEIMADELGATGLGRVRSHLSSPDEDLIVRGGHHHMGTARMHEDPRHGVVDPDGRVQGVANLYVASSATFPTSGAANPTLTIVALALRLADHLAGGSA